MMRNHFHFCRYLWNIQLWIERREEKQLSDRSNGGLRIPTLKGLLGVDREESKFLLKTLPIAKIGCSSLQQLEVDRKLLQKSTCRFKASSLLIILSPDLVISSLTASSHNPQIHFPSYLSRILDMYEMVHSSVNPHESHLINSSCDSEVEIAIDVEDLEMICACCLYRDLKLIVEFSFTREQEEIVVACFC